MLLLQHHVQLHWNFFTFHYSLSILAQSEKSALTINDVFSNVSCDNQFHVMAQVSASLFMFLAQSHCACASNTTYFTLNIAASFMPNARTKIQISKANSKKIDEQTGCVACSSAPCAITITARHSINSVHLYSDQKMIWCDKVHQRANFFPHIYRIHKNKNCLGILLACVVLPSFFRFLSFKSNSHRFVQHKWLFFTRVIINSMCASVCVCARS